MLLVLRVRTCSHDAEHEMLRQQWGAVSRRQYARRNWSPEQEEVFGAVAYTVSLGDEEQKRRHKRCIFLPGGPGLGKSAILLDISVRCASGAPCVHIVCPTNQLPLLFESQLPEVEGIENGQVDTIHGVLRLSARTGTTRSSGHRLKRCAKSISSR